MTFYLFAAVFLKVTAFKKKTNYLYHEAYASLSHSDSMQQWPNVSMATQTTVLWESDAAVCRSTCSYVKSYIRWRVSE